MGSKMEKRYGLPTAISMVIGIVIGSGVFIKGGKVLALTHGNMLQGVLVVALVGAICRSGSGAVVLLLCRLVYDHDILPMSFGDAGLLLRGVLP